MAPLFSYEPTVNCAFDLMPNEIVYKILNYLEPMCKSHTGIH